MHKEEIITILNEKVDNLVSWLENHNDIEFEISKRPGKWTTGQHVDHLIRSMRPLVTVFKMPKFLLKYKFGINNREERSYEQTYNRYINKLGTGTVVPSKRFQPRKIINEQKSSKIRELDCERKRLIHQVRKIKESDLSKYIIPHPAIGRLSFREMLYFTAFHTEHHHNTLKMHH